MNETKEPNEMRVVSIDEYSRLVRETQNEFFAAGTGVLNMLEYIERRVEADFDDGEPRSKFKDVAKKIYTNWNVAVPVTKEEGEYGYKLVMETCFNPLPRDSRGWPVYPKVSIRSEAYLDTSYKAIEEILRDRGIMEEPSPILSEEDYYDYVTDDEYCEGYDDLTDDESEGLLDLTLVLEDCPVVLDYEYLDLSVHARKCLLEVRQLQ